jgi:Protein of unknown function (DUF1161)
MNSCVNFTLSEYLTDTALSRFTRIPKACNELQAEIQAKLDAQSVTGYRLIILASGDVQGHQIVGSCEGGTKKIALHRLRNVP